MKIEFNSINLFRVQRAHYSFLEHCAITSLPLFIIVWEIALPFTPFPPLSAIRLSSSAKSQS